jgi:hypothetical protein
LRIGLRFRAGASGRHVLDAAVSSALGGGSHVVDNVADRLDLARKLGEDGARSVKGADRLASPRLERWEVEHSGKGRMLY